MGRILGMVMGFAVVVLTGMNSAQACQPPPEHPHILAPRPTLLPQPGPWMGRHKVVESMERGAVRPMVMRQRVVLEKRRGLPHVSHRRGMHHGVR